MKILLIGKTGQVGHELLRTLPALGQVVATDRSQLDLADSNAIRDVVRDVCPDVIVNAAAYNAVDRAEEEEHLAMTINGAAPGVLAEEAKRLGALLIHYSTDYVFDGRKRTPYLEDDPPAPLSAYGRSKLAGELAVRSSACRHLLLRTSWVFGPHGSNFVLAMAKRALAGEDLRVVADQTGVPTPASMVADATAKMIAARPPRSGLYHVVATGQTTRFDFARAIIDRLGVKVAVLPVTTEEFGGKARRPSYSVLDNSTVRRDFGVALPDWRTRLDWSVKNLQP